MMEPPDAMVSDPVPIVKSWQSAVVANVTAWLMVTSSLETGVPVGAQVIEFQSQDSVEILFANVDTEISF